MPIYAYRARNTDGRLMEGTLEVSGEGELARRLDSQGMLLTTAKKVKSAARPTRAHTRLKRKELITLTYNLETIYSSGIPLVEGLQDLAEHAGNRTTSIVAASLAEDIQNGSDVSEAMQRHPKAFPLVYRSVVKAGESAGEPGPVLRRLADYYAWLAEMRAAAMRALIYPAVLGLAVCGLIVLLLTFLVPRILKQLSRANAEVPAPTRVLMAMSNFLVDNAVILLCAAVALVIGVIILGRTPRGRLLIDTLKLRIPVLGPLMAKISAARFANTVGMLYRAGIGTVEALESAEHVVGNAFVAQGVRRAREAVTQGETLTSALSTTGAFQPLVVRMIGIGEQTGTLGEALDRVNEFYDREIPQTIKTVLSLLEPAMIVGAGLAVGFILLCTFLPIFEMINSLSRR
jgi:type IV pilus assembly protein PilC